MLSSLVFPKVAHESSNTMWHHHTNVQNQAAKVRQLMQWKWGKVRRRWSHWLTLHSNRIISIMIKITFAKLFFSTFSDGCRIAICLTVSHIQMFIHHFFLSFFTRHCYGFAIWFYAGMVFNFVLAVFLFFFNFFVTELRSNAIVWWYHITNRIKSKENKRKCNFA